MNSERMTSRERSDLAALIRRRAKVSRTTTAHVKAERLADFEALLASDFAAEDERFRDVTKAAAEVAARANEEIQRRCVEMGIPETFRPRLDVVWTGRGENALAERRAELRRVAQTRADADAKAAIEHIEAAALDAEEALLREGLTTGAAREFLERLPTPEQLLPALDLGSVLRALPDHRFDKPLTQHYGIWSSRWERDAAALDELLQARLGNGLLSPVLEEG